MTVLTLKSMKWFYTVSVPFLNQGWGRGGSKQIKTTTFFPHHFLGPPSHPFVGGGGHNLSDTNEMPDDKVNWRSSNAGSNNCTPSSEQTLWQNPRPRSKQKNSIRWQLRFRLPSVLHFSVMSVLHYFMSMFWRFLRAIVWRIVYTPYTPHTRPYTTVYARMCNVLTTYTWGVLYKMSAVTKWKHYL